jgi:hypothetical protein
MARGGQQTTRELRCGVARATELSLQLRKTPVETRSGSRPRTFLLGIVEESDSQGQVAFRVEK